MILGQPTQMCAKTVACYLAIVALAVALLFSIGYYLFHSAGHNNIVNPAPPKQQSSIRHPAASEARTLGG